MTLKVKYRNPKITTNSWTQKTGLTNVRVEEPVQRIVGHRGKSMMNTWDLNKKFDLGKNYDKYVGLEENVECREHITTNIQKWIKMQEKVAYPK